MATKTESKRARIKSIKLLLTPLTEGELALVEKHADPETPDAERDEITPKLPPLHGFRVSVMKKPELQGSLRAEWQMLQYQVDCDMASEANQAALKDPRFLGACEAAGIPPTRRQASKWRNGRRGLALQFSGRIAA